MPGLKFIRYELIRDDKDKTYSLNLYYDGPTVAVKNVQEYNNKLADPLVKEFGYINFSNFVDRSNNSGVTFSLTNNLNISKVHKSSDEPITKLITFLQKRDLISSELAHSITEEATRITQGVVPKQPIAKAKEDKPRQENPSQEQKEQRVFIEYIQQERNPVRATLSQRGQRERDKTTKKTDVQDVEMSEIGKRGSKKNQ